MTFYGKESAVPEPDDASAPLRTYTFKRWGGQEQAVEAHFLTFTPGHVNFWKTRADDKQDTLVFSDVNAQITSLKEVTP